MTPLWIHSAIALAVAFAGFAGGWQVRAWKAGNDDRAQAELVARDAIRRTETASIAAAALENKRAADVIRWRTVTKEVEHVVQEPVYAGTCLSPAGLQLLSDEINRNPHSGEPEPAVPAPASAGAH